MVFCVLFVLLIGRLMYIEYNSGDRYQKIVLSQQEYDSSIIPFKRGDIVDAKGTVLATSIDVYNVILDCKLMNANPEKMEATIGRLATYFPDIDIAKVRQLINTEPNKQYTILQKKVSYEDMHKFEEINEDDDRSNDTAGIWFEKEYIRSYPYDTFAASLLGFTTSGNAGMTGLEHEYNSVLNGTNGRSYGYLNEDSDVEKTVIEPENGNTLVTTLDINIQTIIEEEIAEFNRAYARNDAPGSQHTAVLAMNPQTGEVLAMANFPTFNLNDPWNLAASGVYTKEQVEEMTSDEQLDALNRLWQNYCITTTYEPGSVFKPFTVACGLETGTLTGGEEYYCDGSEHIADFDVHCVKREGHGMLDVRGSLAQSCNDALMQMSYVIGAKNFAYYQALFGFGQRTGIDLPGEAMTYSLVYSEEELEQTINIATNSFGQNFNTTMIQMACAWCSMINGGNLYQPYVMSHATDEAGNVTQKKDPVLLKKTLSKEVSNQMKEYCRAVITEGSGAIGGVSGYDVGGKTGTAQKLPRSWNNYLDSFMAYVPQDEPKLLLYCIVDVPNVPDQAHSTYPMELGHNILVQILPYMGIEPTGEESERSAAGKIEYGSASGVATYTNNASSEDGEEAEEGEAGVDTVSDAAAPQEEPTDTPQTEEPEGGGLPDPQEEE